MNTRRQTALVMTALFIALSYVATSVLVIPSPAGGYMNLGDAVVLLGAYLLGPVGGAVAGGLGSALADFMTGYSIYAPATLIIKALMGVTAAVLYQALGRKGFLISGLAAEGVMMVGYVLYDTFLTGSLAVGLTGIPANLVQGVFGVVASAFLANMLRNSSYVRKVFPRI